MYSLKRHIFVVLLAVCMTRAEMPPWIIDNCEQFGLQLLKLDERFSLATNNIPNEYVGNLAKLKNEFKNDGDLDGLLAVDRELKRFSEILAAEPDPFEPIPEMTADVIVDTPEKLGTLQREYINKFRKAEEAYKRATSEAGQKLQEQFEETVQSLTRSGKIDDAISVRTESKKLIAQISDGDLTIFRVLAQKSGKNNKTVVGRDVKEPPNKRSGFAQWNYMGQFPFSMNLLKFRHPDLPEQISAAFDSNHGRVSFRGNSRFASIQADAVLCTQIGKAMAWEIPTAEALATKIFVKSLRTTSSSSTGPSLQIIVLQEGKKIEAFDIPIINRDIEISVMQNPKKTEQFMILWHGTSKQVRFELDESKKIQLLLGVSFHNVGESCDTTVEFK